MTNLYWPVYKNLEKEVIRLSEYVHFDDNQLSTYSAKIAELLIRCSIEIESISKDLYFRLGGPRSYDRDLYFDTDCIQLIENKWILSKKKVIVAAPNFFFQKDDNKVLTPLYKANRRGTSGADWKKAYQAIKHNRVGYLPKGSIKNLVRALAALYLLNIYFKDETYDLEKDSKATNLPINMGSDIFAIKIHKGAGFDEKGNISKNDDFDECVYLIKIKKDSQEKLKLANQKEKEARDELFSSHPKIKAWFLTNKIEDYRGDNFLLDVLGREKYYEILRQAAMPNIGVWESIEYKAILNKNSI